MQLADVTIIIPVYCTTQESLVWLEECLDSATSQGCKVKVIDDGSPIKTENIINFWLKNKHDYMMMYHRGVSAARNHAIEIARTDLIFPLDCDDRLVPGAITTLLDMYNGTPLYCDISKFGDVTMPHYALLDFACANVRKYVGFTSVNVLHSKEQWKTIGGYDEALDFYEDGEYNARLYLKYCGMRCPRPLVEYRIHKGQRTDVYKDQSSKYARELLAKIGDYDMACASCGKRRTPSSFVAGAGTTATAVPSSVNVDEMPLTNGTDVLVQYVGGRGRGKHYYNGLVTARQYKVMYGMYLYVDAQDIPSSQFVRITRVEKKVAVAPKQPEVAASPVTVQVKTVTEVTKEVTLPDISNMTIKSILASEEITADNASALLAIEEQGHKRDSIIKYLKGLLA